MTVSGKVSCWRHVLLFLLFLALFLSAYYVFVLFSGALGVFSPLPSPECIADGSVFSSASPLLFVIDAGHGGMDSGALAEDGSCEKDINLAIAQKVGAFLEAAGAQVVYTRTQDVLLEYEGAPTKKSGDLMARVQCAKAHSRGVFVSIHMNKFPQSQYSGLQVFYSPNHPLSARLAMDVQEGVVSLLQPENRREAKKAGGEIFVLDRLQGPAVLIECGFLSNARELTRLKSEEYQSALSYVIAHSLLQGMAEENQE